MCELFAVSSRLPVTVNLSLDRFAAHGSADGPNHDGWGIAFYRQRDAMLIKEAIPAASSDCMRFVESHDMRSRLVLAHIRHASRGDVTFENTQPFVRELGGRAHVFAHNGDLGPAGPADASSRRFRPVGETDSERAFCTLLTRLAVLWEGDAGPSIADRVSIVGAFAAEIRALGPANFIYTDGELLFAHGDRRHARPDEPAHAPGMHVLVRAVRGDVDGDARGSVSGGGVDLATHHAEESAVILASVPLTDEAWSPLPRGRLLVAAEGRRLDDPGKRVDDVRPWSA